LPGYIFILVLLVLMWFLLIRPQRRRQLDQQRMIDALEVGKEIVTAGGLYGTVTELADDEVHLEIAEGVEVRVAKRAVAGIMSEEEEAKELEAAEEPEEETPAAKPPVRDSAPEEGVRGKREVPPTETPAR
jgi:preprotein translocase subunit YajC